MKIFPRLKKQIDIGKITIDGLAKDFDEETALNWAYYIGDRDIMIKKIKSEEYLYDWPYCMDNQDIMIKENKIGGICMELGPEYR